MDSQKIAEKIEVQYPEPSAHLASPVLAKLFSVMPRLMTALQPVYLVAVPKNLLGDESLEYWHETRSEMVNMPLDQLDREKGGQQPWDAAKPILDEIEALLQENSDGPFFLGKTPSYADFVWAGFLIFFQRNQNIEGVYKISGDSQLHKDLLEATAPWHKRNDH